MSQSALSHEEMQRSLQKSRSQLGQKFERNKWAVQKDIDRNQERTTAKLRKGRKELLEVNGGLVRHIMAYPNHE